jgi:O-antigen/teichoic acid export membrane protein
MSSTLYRISRNVFSNWVGYVVNIAVSFFLAPFMVHSLGDAGYGIWVLVGSLTGYLGILDMGLRPAIVKFVARYKTLGDDLMVNRIVNTTLVVLSIAAAIVFLASLVLSLFFVDLFKIPDEFHGQFQLIVIIVGLNLAAGFPFSVLGSLLAAIERFDLGNAVQVLVFLVRAALIVVFLKLGGGLVAVGLIVLAASTTEFLLKARLSLKHFPKLEISSRFADRDTFKLIAGFSSYTFIMNVASRLSFQTDAIVIGAMLSAEAITSFSIGSTMVDYLFTLISYMSTTLLPLASAFDAQQNFEKLRQLLIIGTKYCVAVILPISFAYLVLGETFINLWMGPQYGPTSAKVLVILTCGYFGFLSQSVANVIFHGLGKLKYIAYLNISLAVVNLGLSIVLVKWLGAYGSALGTAIPLTIIGLIIYPIYICRTVKLGILQYVGKAYLRPLLASLPFLTLLLICHQLLNINSYGRFIMVIGSACIVHAVMVFYCALEPDHRSSISQKVRYLWLPR